MPDTDSPTPTTTRGARQDLLASLRQLSDEELVARLKGLAARERRATALLVAHLAELDTRDVYLREGFSSLFSCCREVLALSEHEAYNRIEAARTARRFPVVLDLLAAGDVNLTTVRLLGPHLTPENHQGVLESARGKRKAEVEEIVARLAPRADVPASVRKLPERKPASLEVINQGPPVPMASMPHGPAPAAVASGAWEDAGSLAPSARARGATAGSLAPAAAGLPAVAAPVLPHARRSAQVTPLSPDRYRYQLTIGGATLEKLRLAKDLMRHALPSGDDEAILDRALTALLTDLARKKFGARKEAGAPRRPEPSADRLQAPGSRHFPAPVKRAVSARLRSRHLRGYGARALLAREPVGEGRHPPGAGRPVGVLGTADPSSPGRSGTSRHA